MSSVVFIDSFSVGLDEINRKSQRNPVRVLRLIYRAGKFSIFEATANEVIANTLGWLQGGGYFELDNSCGYPWFKVIETEKGREMIGDL